MLPEDDDFNDDEVSKNLQICERRDKCQMELWVCVCLSLQPLSASFTAAPIIPYMYLVPYTLHVPYTLYLTCTLYVILYSYTLYCPEANSTAIIYSANCLYPIL